MTTPDDLTNSRSGLPLVNPDEFEQEMSDEIDNSIPTRGYHELPVVGLGGSAGSIPALREFFKKTPPNTGLAYVVILQLSPEHESTMDQVLQRSTEMPVKAAADGEKIQPDTVYVIPSGKHLTLTDGHFRLTDLLNERGKRVAVDLFFRSLADTHGPHSTAIVLSGADGDGAIGLRRIKERGGLTIAQDPDEAEHSSMPQSAINTGMVDWILKVAEMPERVIQYRDFEGRLKLPSEIGPPSMVPQQLEANQRETALREVLAFLRTRTGRDFSYYKRATVVRRIARRMQVNGVDDLVGYLSCLRTQPGEAGALLQDLLISVTNFFRDREAFDCVTRQIPGLFQGKGSGDVVRVWVAACATGEEVYSMAILLLEHARSLENPPAVQVFGCDLDEQAIQVARSGFFPDAISADVSEDRLRRFFVKEPHGYRVKRDVREMVLFAAHDLLKDAPFSRMDLISCRNLLIYLNQAAQKRAIETFHFALKPNGLLFLGASENVEEDSSLFTPVSKKYRIYMQRPGIRATLPVPIGSGTISKAIQMKESFKDVPVLPSPVFDQNATVPSPRVPSEGGASLGELHFQLIERFASPSVLVNHNHEIVHLSPHAGRFLQFTGGQPSVHLLRVIHPALRLELRAALLRAAETDEPADVSRMMVEMEGSTKAINMHVTPAQDLAPGFLLVTFEAVDPGVSIDVQPARTEPEPVVRQLERELERMKGSLRDTVEQHESSTEELRASNEELQAMNEELRSATEELETSREELQSINEELTTVNQELKSKVEELGHSNSDLHNLMASTAIATIFLDRELHITRYTPPAVSLFHLIPGDIGRPLGDLTVRIEYPELIGDAEQVLQTLVPIEREVRGRDNDWYLARSLPYRTLDDRIAGIVFTFVNITVAKRTEESLRISRGELEVALEQTTRAHKAAQTANKTKDRFLAMLSHELRTPLTPVLTATEAMLRQKDLPLRAEEALRMIQRNVEMEMHFINDLLDLTRIAHGKLDLHPAPLDINDAIRAAVEIAGADLEAKEQKLTLELTATNPNFRGDSTRLQQVFWNLLKNSSKFTPEAGKISIRSRDEPGFIVLEVLDAGRGIDPSTLPNIFEAFRQGDDSIGREFGGLGLGLAISKAAVEAHGGTIEASSLGKGKGSTFTVRLPLNYEF